MSGSRILVHQLRSGNQGHDHISKLVGCKGLQLHKKTGLDGMSFQLQRHRNKITNLVLNIDDIFFLLVVFMYFQECLKKNPNHKNIH